MHEMSPTPADGLSSSGFTVSTGCSAAAGKTKQKKKASADIDGLLASIGEEPTRQDTQSGVAEADEAQAIKQTQKKKRREGRLGGDVDALLAQLGGTALQKAEKAPQSEAGEVPQQADEQKPPASKADQVKNKAQDVRKGADEDIEALTAESSKSIKAEQPSNDNKPAEKAAEQPSASSAADETTAGKAQRHKKKKKGKQVATVDTLISRAICDMICILQPHYGTACMAHIYERFDEQGQNEQEAVYLCVCVLYRTSSKIMMTWKPSWQSLTASLSQHRLPVPWTLLLHQPLLRVSQQSRLQRTQRAQQ